MASAPPSQPPPQLGHPPQPSPDAASSVLSWEGDKMFNIYIYDYCHKRGFKKTARELLAEADIAPESTPPINARQGLLFEWWSVFWVLFQAKSNPLGGATEDALTYTQYQARQAAMRLQNTQPSAPPPPGPPLHLAGASTGGMPHRLNNGLQQPQRPGNFMPNGSLPNGAGPPGVPGPPFTQPNGNSNAGNQHHPHQQGPAFMPGSVPRPPINGPPPPPGQVQQVRGVGTGPFHSPTMAHSPPGSGVPQQTNQFGVPVGTSPHMGNMVMGRNMIPHSPMNPNTQGNTPQPGQQPMQGPSQFTGGRPPSRTTTPADVHPSPSLTQRQVTGDIINMEVLNIPNATLEVLKGELGLAGKDVSALTSNDKQRILTAFRTRRPSIPKPGESMGPGPSNLMRSNLQQTQSMQNRNNKRNSNSPGDEHEHLRTESSPPDRKRPRTSPGQTPSMAPMYPGQQQQGTSGMQHPGMQTGAGGMPGGMPGPGGMQGPNSGMSGPMQQGGMQSGASLGMPPGMQGHGPGGLPAPGAPNMVPQGPLPQPGGMPPGAPGMQQGPPGGGPGPGMQHHMGGPTNMMMPGGRMVNGGPHGGGQMGMGPHMGGMPQMNHPMGPPGVPPNMTAYRQNMAKMHQNNMPMNNASPGDSSFNPGLGPQFNPNPGSRPMNNPAIGGQPQHRMHPPASPAPGKDGNKDGKPMDGSPRNQQTPNQGPTTPAPNHQNATSNQGTPVGGPRTAPSPVPNAVMGGLNPMNQAGGMNMGMGGMMGMNQPPPPNSGMSGGSGGGGNNGAPGNGGNGAPGSGAGAGPGGGVGGGSNAGGAGSGIGSGMNFLGMNPMAGMNGPVGTGIGGGMNSMNPPSSSNGNNGDGGGGNGGMGMQDLVFSHEFMQSVANTLVDDLDPTMVFRPDGDINFERDFGQWFHPEDSLDLK